MKPAIFVSSVSRELKTARQLVANTLLALGYEPVWQDIFETSSDDLRDFLRKKIDDCSAVMQIVGDAYGAEPPTVDPAFGRISYTQFEALYAKSSQKPVYYLITQPDFPQDASPEQIDGPCGDTDADREDAAVRRQLQRNYKSQVQQAGTRYHPVQNVLETELAVRRIKDELAALRRDYREWQTSVTAKLDTLPERIAKVDALPEEVTKSVSAGLDTSSAEEAQYLLEHSCELSNRGEDERAIEVVEEATRLARQLKNEKLERACLLHEANVLFWHKTDERRIPQSVISRLQSILRRFDYLGQETSHAFQVRLHLSRLRGDHDETIANCNSILQCDDDFVDAKVEAITALLVALAQLDRVGEMDGLLGEVERLANQCEFDQKITLQMNWLLANADAGRFQHGLTEQFIGLMDTAMAKGEFDLPNAIDAVHTVGPRLQLAADRTDWRDWDVAAYKLFAWGYKLAEEVRDAKRAIEFCEQLARISVQISTERSEAMEWIKKGELTFSWPTQFESSDARLASQCFFTYTKARVLWRLTKRYDGPNDKLMYDGLLRGALKGFQEAADLFERCRGAIDGDADLLAGDGVLAQGQIYFQLGDYVQAIAAFQNLWNYPGFTADPQRAFSGGTRLGSLYAEAGNFERAWLLHNMLEKHPKLTPELRNRLAEFNSYLKEMEARDGKRARVVVPRAKPKDEVS